MAEALKCIEVLQDPDLVTQRLHPLEPESPQPKETRGAGSITAGAAHSVGTWPCRVDAWNRCQRLFVFPQALVRRLEGVFEHPSRNLASCSA